MSATEREYAAMRATDPADPVIFHEVTSRAVNHKGTTAEDLLRAGAALVPPTLRERHPQHATIRRGWPMRRGGEGYDSDWEPRGLTGGIDAQAGDLALTFFDLGWCRASGVRPAFGFRLRDVVAWCGRKVGFRPRDLISAYRTASDEYLNGLRSTNETRWKVLTGSIQALAADDTLTQVMRRIAACGTAYDAALPLARLHLLAVHRYEDTWDQAAHMVPYCGLEESRRDTPDGPYPDEWAFFWGTGRILWDRAFRPDSTRRRASHAEIVVGCPLPVRLARYYLGRGGWDLNPFYRSTVLP